jgi:ammonium transporter, Amt family
MEPHNATLTILGAALLWFGWFGFNAGSALGSGVIATAAFVNTNTAAAMASLTWLTASWIHHRRPSALGAAAGALAGLVGITPASGFVSPMGALLIGFVAGLACFAVVEFLVRGRIDDSLDVFGVHGVGGTVGMLATGLLATRFVNPAGADGLFYGNARLVLVQSVAVLATAAYSAAMTWGLLRLVDALVGLRVSPEEEVRGLDLSQHGELAYKSQIS